METVKYFSLINLTLQVYDEDSDEKRSANMNMGPRTWYQVPRDLRYPEVRIQDLGSVFLRKGQRLMIIISMLEIFHIFWMNLYGKNSFIFCSFSVHHTIYD